MENIGVCAPGGGALCSAQAGQLKALYEWLTVRDLKPLAVRGASGGDLNSSIFVQAFADGGDSIVTMEEMWKTISHRKVHTLIPHVYPRSTGLFRLTPLRSMLERTLDRSKLIESGVNYTVRASRYGKGVDIEIGPENAAFFDMLTASAAYPFMFKPIRIWGSYFADSGINSNVPVNRLIQAGCDTIFVVRPYPRTDGKTLNHKDVRMFRLIWHVLGELMNAQLDAQLEEVNQINRLIDAGFMPDKKKIRLIELAPSKEPELGVMEFNAKKCGAAFDDGYRNARKSLVGLK